MANIHDREALLRENLKDAGCDAMLAAQILDDLQRKDLSGALFLLRRHKAQLLKQLHNDGCRIDCLDYLIFQLTHHQKG